MDTLAKDSILYEIQELAYVLENAKEAEALAKRGRVDAEEQIAALVPTEDTCQKTITLDNGTKITVKRGLSYKADVQAIEKVFNELEQVAPLKSKTTVELDVKGYEYYRKEEPEFFGVLSQYVTVTPKKVAVSLVVK